VTEPTAQPPISPDGQWKWDGTQWVPNTTYPQQPSYGAPGYGAPGYGAPAPYYAPAPSQNDGKAIASLVCGLVGGCGVGSIAAIILGHQSRGAAKREGRQPSGMALAGLILGYVGLVGAILFLGLIAAGTWAEGAFDDTVPACVSQYADSC
jgi:hypothetical protein